jgi:glycosyltransferase involved in cell wall biosynthesis
MKKVCIGVYVHAEPQLFHETLSSIRRNTNGEYELHTLPDGPDSATIEALKKLRDLPQSATNEPRGTAACFNRLAALSDADVIVLLESGCVVGQNWLDYLLQALESNPQNGLTGPSTNQVWNEQCAFPNRSNTFENVERTAAEAASIFGAATRTLEPLYSLADFCYAVKREVIETIGAADESYGLGPCWEMDYNIRAARSGWRGVWACGAYIYRSPLTVRRLREETTRFEISKRLYQDRFCGARIRGEKNDYRSHCSGDACPNFAPSHLITIHCSLPLVEEKTTPLICAGEIEKNESPLVACIETNEPLVTCIMPTYNRGHYIPQAIRSFQRQTYSNKELLIVDDSEQAIESFIPSDERIRYLRLDNKLTIGAKRNVACENALGEFIVHWDDDDWYPGNRISKQISAMQESGAGISGSSRIYYHEAATNRAWEYRYESNGTTWVGGNTLAYRKSVWQRNRFQDVQVGEDARFVWNEANAYICDLADAALCVASVHSNNTSIKNTDSSFWYPINSEIVRDLLGDEINFYRFVSEPSSQNLPLVSCIMPTYNRPEFVPQALEHFYAQDYPNKELIIVDDGEDSVEELVAGFPDVNYIRLNTRHSIGAKRNVACRYARGEIIAHWDDDDWYSSDRLRYQAAPLIEGEADITGLENSYVVELQTETFWTTQDELHKRMFVGDVHGGTLVYRKELLKRGLSYPEIDLAEDAWLVHRAVQMGFRLLRLSNPGVFVYVRHSSNAWRECQPGKFIDPEGWQKILSPKFFPKNFSTLFDNK